MAAGRPAPGPLILDGIRLASERRFRLRERAERVTRRRDRAPCLALVAFGNAGRAPHVQRKIESAHAAGVVAVPLIVPASASTDDALQKMHDGIASRSWDGVFLQFPFPDSVDGDRLAASIPEHADVDVMTPAGIRRYLGDETADPPVTVAAGLALLDAYDVPVAAADGVVIAEPGPFATMFREALVRRSAGMRPVLEPERAAGNIGGAELVIVAAARPGFLPAQAIPAGAVVIDAGYFNPGGRGDVDASGGMDHLRAIARVPGGIGPMTVSMLIERVIQYAERPEPGRVPE
ncbi:MAG: tetrahydrofolate dehydrogenase/cyclohydrolase catalytic domain-containing protein [Longimicrobiales bacterium]